MALALYLRLGEGFMTGIGRMGNLQPFALRTSSDRGYLPQEKLIGLGRCPHCAVATPNMNRVWSDSWSQHGRGWSAFRCNTCDGVVVCLMEWETDRFSLVSMWPIAQTAHTDIPEPARTFLQQAYDTLHAPDAAAVMAGSAVDAMLKAHGLIEGSLYARIDAALQANLLTKGMAEWAHSVRLGSNRPRHSDKEKPHVSKEEAKQSVEFAEALGSFLFVLTAKIDRGIAAAEKATS